MKNMNGYKMILGAAEKMFVRTAPGHTETATISFPNLLFNSPLSNLDYTNIELQVNHKSYERKEYLLALKCDTFPLDDDVPVDRTIGSKSVVASHPNELENRQKSLEHVHGVDEPTIR
jgi:hypothetical protein